jgi:hypothetical protein
MEREDGCAGHGLQRPAHPVAPHSGGVLRTRERGFRLASNRYGIDDPFCERRKRLGDEVEAESERRRLRD